MSDSSFAPLGGSAALPPARRRLAWSIGLSFALLAIAMVAQLIYVHFIHGIPVVGEVDPIRTMARVVFVTSLLLLCYPLASLIADGRSMVAPIADATITVLRHPRWCLRLVPIAFALVLFVVWILRAFPNSGDEYNYIFQAETFQAGRLWNPLPEAAELFRFSHAFMLDGKWVSQYAPGWAALLALAHLAGLPYWLVNPLLGLVLLVLAYRLAAWRAGGVAGAATVVLLGFTIFFLFNAASYFAHVYVAIFGLLFCAAAESYRREPGMAAALLMGTAIGLVALNRPFDAVLLCLPYAIAIVWRLRWRHVLFAPVAALGAVPFLAAALAYNASVTGDPLLPVTNWGYPDLKLGILHAVNESGVVMTLAQRAQQAVSRFYLLAEWTSPIFLILFGSSCAHLWRRRRLVPADFMIVVFALAYITFPGYGGVQYGPRYYFEAFPLMVITCGAALADWLRGDAAQRASRFAVALLALHVLVSLPAIPAFARATRVLIDERMDLYDVVDKQGLRNAVVIVNSTSGRLDPLGPLDLTRNGIDPIGSVIYALPLPDAVPRLKALYPSRQIFVYRRDDRAVTGKLVPIR